MHDGVRKFISDCAASTMGRFVFVAYLIYIVSMISYAYGHFPFMTYPYRFYGERELFELMNLPQLELIRSTRLIFRWQASKFTDAVFSVYIALPWWVYGYLFERLVKRIADTSSREALAEECMNMFEVKERVRLGRLRRIWLNLGCGPRNAEMHEAELRKL